jgi:hypothetical protein
MILALVTIALIVSVFMHVCDKSIPHYRNDFSLAAYKIHKYIMTAECHAELQAVEKQIAWFFEKYRSHPDVMDTCEMLRYQMNDADNKLMLERLRSITWDVPSGLVQVHDFSPLVYN